MSNTLVGSRHISIRWIRYIVAMMAAVILTPIAWVAHSPPASAASMSAWNRVADCESGVRINGKPVPGSARWHLPGGHADSTGGLQIQDRTWRDFGGTKYAAHAYQTSKENQIKVGKEIVKEQGNKAWTCAISQDVNLLATVD